MNNRTKYILVIIGLCIAGAIVVKIIFNTMSFFSVPIAFIVGYLIGKFHGKRSAS
jgi:hypothetical protein